MDIDRAEQVRAHAEKLQKWVQTFRFRSDESLISIATIHSVEMLCIWKKNPRPSKAKIILLCLKNERFRNILNKFRFFLHYATYFPNWKPNSRFKCHVIDSSKKKKKNGFRIECHKFFKSISVSTESLSFRYLCKLVTTMTTKCVCNTIHCHVLGKRAFTKRQHNFSYPSGRLKNRIRCVCVVTQLFVLFAKFQGLWKLRKRNSWKIIFSVNNNKFGETFYRF